jgi:GNT-I family protein
MQLVVFTAFNRPAYMRETLRSWGKARCSTIAFFDFHVEPGCPEMEEACYAPAPWIRTVHVNQVMQGVQRNPFNAMNCAFDRLLRDSKFRNEDDFVILAEDDFVVSTDIFEWFDWARREFYADEKVLAVSAAQYEEQPGGLAQSLKISRFPGWVWGTWRDRWENLIAPDWTFDYEHNGWDWRLTDYWCKEKGMVCVVPAVSRSQHIGEHGGVHTIPGQPFLAEQSKCFVPEIPPQEYRRPELQG